MVKYEIHPSMCLWQHTFFSVSGNKSTEIKTSNHFVRPLQLPLWGKKTKKTSSTILKLAWKGRMLHSKSKSIVANSPRLILALIQHGTRAQVIKMSSPLLLAPNSPLQIVFLFFFKLFCFASLHSPNRWAPVVYMCVYEERDSSSHRMLINWSPVDNGEEVCGHDSESFRWNGRCLITAAVSAVE